MSSLQQQLQSIASLDASRLTSRTGQPSSKSYLFPPNEAASHDLDAIFALGSSGFEELVSLDPDFAQYEDELFSDRSKRTDRMLLNPTENAELDKLLERCLRRLGRWVGIMAGGRCLEWLVRRFRVHEMNAEVLLQVFLPYHASPNFARILAIISLPNESAYHVPFAPLVKNAQPVPRSYITTVIAPEREKSLRLLEDVAGMLSVAIAEGAVHRALIAFWSGVMVELIDKSAKGKGLSEGLVKVLVETFVTVLSTRSGGKDVNAAVYPPLILLTRSTYLADEPFAAILTALLSDDSGADASQRLLSLLVILNDRQSWDRGLESDAAKALVRIDGLESLLLAAMERYDFNQALSVILGEMVGRIDTHLQTLQSLVKSSNITSTLIHLVASRSLLLGSDANAPAPIKAATKTFLSGLRERYPAIVDAVALETPDLDHDLIARPDSELAMLSVLSADVTARALGVEAVMSPHLGKPVPTDEAEALKLALESRLADSDVQVLDALYRTKEHQKLIWNVVGADTVIATIRPAFVADKLDEAVVKRHIDFVSAVSNEFDAQRVFEQLLFPVVMPTNGRALSAEAWEVLRKSDLAKHSSVVKALVHGDHSSVEGVAKTISGAIQPVSTTEAAHTFVLSQLSTDIPTSRLLAHIVVAHLLPVKSPHVEFANRVLEQLRPLLTGAPIPDFDDADIAISARLFSMISSKPKASRTSQRATLALFYAMTKINRSAQSPTWLDDEETSFKRYAKTTYLWANSDILPLQLARSLLQSLFFQLGSEALLFLASVWTDHDNSSGLRLAALKHASSFVTAHKGQNGIDFQLLLPSILIALGDNQPKVRAGGVGLLKSIVLLAGNGDEVYALDTIYGAKSDQVKLLKQTDIAAYLGWLSEASEQFAVDGKQVHILHSEKLSQRQGETKKDVAQRRAIIGALLSHVVSWQSISVRLAILRILSGSRDIAFFRGSLPLLLSAQSNEKNWDASLSDKQREEYVDLLFSGLDANSVHALVEGESKGWTFVKSLLSATDVLSAQLRNASLRQFSRGVFNALPHAMRAEYLQEMVSALDQISTDDAFALKATLAALPVDAAVLISVLSYMSRPLEGSAASQKKRQKQDEGNDDSIARAISQLTALLDSRDFSKITPSPALLASLMSLLSLILARRQSIREGLDYLEQEILSALVALLIRITDPQDITRAHIGIEVVIKVIRASGNPRTAQRALLVAGELARLVPEAVLHNIMPIFTFMGSSDLQRDDAYSFGVVEKTVERIVPVMTRSLRAKSKSKLELYQESKTFISIFTDMAARLPKHRTLPFFVHLVRSLGADDYLAPICMLLVDRSTTKAGRSGNSVAQTMELPQGVAAAFETDTKIETVLEIVREVARLVDDLSREDKEAFLANPDADQDRLLRQLTGLLSLASTLAQSIVGKPADQGVAEELVRSLLLLASSVSTSTISTSTVPAAVQGCLGTSMSLLSAQKFLGVVATLLQGDNEQDITIALSVLIERLPRVRPDIRAANAAVIGDILKKTAMLVKPSKRIVSVALGALHAIASTAQKGEDAALASVLPGLIAVVPTLGEAIEQVALLSLLEVAVRHLGSRIIPHIQSIVTTTLALPPSSFSLTRQVFTLQAALIEVVANFMAPKQIVAICQNALKGHEGSREVINVVSKKVPTKTVWPVVMDLWKSVQTESSTVLSDFFDLLRLVLKNSDRNALPSLIKPIFAFFLDVFDLRYRLQLRQLDGDDINRVEDSAIGSFLELVTKLNEATFRPLFVRVYDWAVVDLSEGKAIGDGRLVERRTVLFRVMMGLLSKFKNLLSPYIGILLPHIEELLPAYANGEIADQPLLNLLLDLLARSFDVDEGAYWTDAAYQKLLPSLVSLLDSSVTGSTSLDSEDTPAEHLATCLAAVAAATTTEQTLKSLNTAICLSTRSDVVSSRLASLKALEAVWARQAEELVPYVQETVGEFLSELVEDENGDVEVLARRVVKGIEANVGTVGEYLE